jgi:hypothetical protein
MEERGAQPVISLLVQVEPGELAQPLTGEPELPEVARLVAVAVEALALQAMAIMDQVLPVAQL